MFSLRDDWNKMKNGVIYKTSFSDNNGSRESIIEHGDFFDEVPHIKISCH
jgi:hypothetical protein